MKFSSETLQNLQYQFYWTMKIENPYLNAGVFFQFFISFHILFYSLLNGPVGIHFGKKKHKPYISEEWLIECI